MATAASLGLLALLMLPSCFASCFQLQAHDRCRINSFELFACLNASTSQSFDSRGGRECRDGLITLSYFCVTEVANVTTAVDIYSFGMCALEVSVENFDCGKENEFEGRRWLCRYCGYGWFSLVTRAFCSLS